MSKTKIDMIESASPPPTGNIEIWDAREILPENIDLIGGIESTEFLNLSLHDLENYIKKLMFRMKKRKYILANSDSCPPGVNINKFEMVTGLATSRSQF